MGAWGILRHAPCNPVWSFTSSLIPNVLWAKLVVGTDGNVGGMICLPGARWEARVEPKIKEALDVSARAIPGLTDWVLWTRRPLTKGDQDWFTNLKVGFRLHQWTADDVEHHLCGEAELLRGTYFGELVLTPSLLRERHEESVAPIKIRWQPAVHRPVDAERALRAMLGKVEVGRICST